MAPLTERQLIELAAERIDIADWITARQRAAERISSDVWITTRQRESRRDMYLFRDALEAWDARIGHAPRPTVWNVSVNLPDWSSDDDTPANFVAEDPISFFGIKEVV